MSFLHGAEPTATAPVLQTDKHDQPFKSVGVQAFVRVELCAGRGHGDGTHAGLRGAVRYQRGSLDPSCSAG